MKEEVRLVGLTILFFAAGFLGPMGFKALILAVCGTAFCDVSVAPTGVFIVAKVVLILENVPLGLGSRNVPESYMPRCGAESTGAA